MIAAQGGSLEGAEDKESCLSEDLVALADTPPRAMPGSPEGLEATVEELSARLTRLEGLMLEMTSQMMPALMKTLEKPLLANPAQEVFLPCPIALHLAKQGLHYLPGRNRLLPWGVGGTDCGRPDPGLRRKPCLK